MREKKPSSREKAAEHRERPRKRPISARRKVVRQQDKPKKPSAKQKPQIEPRQGSFPQPVAKQEPALNLDDLSLYGQLDFIDAPNLFKMIGTVHATGLLELDSGTEKVEVYFLNGRLVFAQARSNKIKLGSLLVKKGLVSKEQAQDALDTFKAEKGRRKLGEILIAKGHITAEKLQEAIGSQIKIAVYSAILWKKGTFSFIADIAPPAENLILDVDTKDLVDEVLSRADSDPLKKETDNPAS